MGRESNEPDTMAAQARRSVGRPPQTPADIAQRKQQIVEAAYAVFAERGYHATGIADIATRLGVGHGTIYRYFDNKRAILDRVIDFAVARAMDGLVLEELGRVDTAADFRVQLTRLGDSLDKHLVEVDPALIRILALDAAGIDEELLQRVLGLLEAAIATLEGGLAEARARGFLRPGLDVDHASRAVVGCILGGVVGQLRGAGMTRKARLAYIDTVVSLICDNAEPGTAL